MMHCILRLGSPFTKDSSSFCARARRAAVLDTTTTNCGQRQHMYRKFGEVQRVVSDRPIVPTNTQTDGQTDGH